MACKCPCLYNALPGDTHARHIAGQFMGVAKSYCNVATRTENPEYLTLSQEWLKRSQLWLDLLDSFPEFRSKELESMEGAFPEYAQGQGAQSYLEHALKVLKGS